MLTWMIYALSVSAVLSVAALIAEHSARQRRSPSRGFWLIAIVASLVIPAIMTSVSIEIPADLKPSVPRNVIALHEITSTHLSPAVWVENHRSIAAMALSMVRVRFLSNVTVPASACSTRFFTRS